MVSNQEKPSAKRQGRKYKRARNIPTYNNNQNTSNASLKIKFKTKKNKKRKSACYSKNYTVEIMGQIEENNSFFKGVVVSLIMTKSFN